VLALRCVPGGILARSSSLPSSAIQQGARMTVSPASPSASDAAPVIDTADLDAAIASLDLALPVMGADVDQDEEWALVRVHADDADGIGRWRRIRLHDYDEVFAVPGLYEKWVYHALRCTSPRVVVGLLGRAMLEAGDDPAALTVLDLGAGNGCVGEELAGLGVRRIVGADICAEAAVAAERDRPGLYDAYAVGDITQAVEGGSATEAKAVLDAHAFNAMVCVAALGYGDVPPEVFMAAFDRVAPGGWVGFNIKAEFLDEDARGGFAGLVREMLSSGRLGLAARERYVHRLAPDGSELVYEAMVGRKA
jgi:SAM-dependent methyltransferase